MNKYKRRFYKYIFVVGPILFILGCLSVFGVINTAYYGFALDESSFLYVGKTNKIDVYGNEGYVKTVFKKDGWYAFTIQDEKLYIATNSGAIKVLDLSGNLIETIDDSTNEEADRLEKQKSVFFKDDAEYRATNVLGYYKITKFSNGRSEIIYRRPALDYFCAIAQIAVIISVPVFLIMICPSWYREWLLGERAKSEKR